MIDFEGVMAGYFELLGFPGTELPTRSNSSVPGS